ncbi:MAG: ornithine carbamoyltransferase [Candidatus Cloacimonadota bacterium]|nr:MAG: ornithine carbamoyltransferase [Candidatus Cloacimonadota bacterium]
MDLIGRDLICTQDWSIEELIRVIELAEDMQKHRYSNKYTSLLRFKTFLMFFYNPSVRTRQSFEAAATELGGHAQFLEPKSMRLKTEKSTGETIEDAANVMSRYAVGLGIRILEDKISAYGDGDKLIREYAKYCTIPVINMADDKYHPCQGLADVMGLRKHLGKNLKGKKLLQIWGNGALARSWCSVQESLIINSRFGMDITLAYPDGYELDPEVIEMTKYNCAKNNAKFEIVHNVKEGYNGADVVYSRNWMSPDAYDSGKFNKAKEIEKAMQYTNWICDEEKMRLTNNALFIHPMPVDRGNEVTDDVASGKRSIIYDIAENRLHIQKSVMALTMANLIKS